MRRLIHLLLVYGLWSSVSPDRVTAAAEPGQPAAQSASAANDDARQPTPAEIEYFETKIRPLLFKRCYECHSSTSKSLRGGLRLDTPHGIRQGGDTGPAVVGGDPDASLLIEAVRYGADGPQMPPSGKLPDAEIEELVRWVKRGAPLPKPVDVAAPAERPAIDFETGRKFWSFQPVEMQPLPVVARQEWPQRRIDYFILAEIEKNGLSPSLPADRRTLLRRAMFDLVGLPPTPDEVDAFVDDNETGAYERLVDQLLSSPHYGERWGRHWLDLVRYTDKNASWLSSTDSGWLYRDWVVRALNDDVPYDQFVQRQLATDLMPETGPEDTPALGLIGLSPTYWKELKLDKDVIKTVVAEEWEERIDAFSRTFLGLSVACARCHDHKFDPIGTEDYYALAGVFASTRLIDRPTIPAEQADVVMKARAEVAALEKQAAELLKKKGDEPVGEPAKQQAEQLQSRIAEIKRSTPHYDVPFAHAVDDASLYVLADGPDATKLEYKPGEPQDLNVFIRGNPASLGKLVPRRFLTVLSAGEPQPFRHGSGRLELADALFHEGAPLAARVIVNRVWRYHFGRGLVDTPSDFGAQGSRPTHPQLLDDLAARFVENGWSLKWLHREIMLSATYRQASVADAATHAADPSNRLLARMNRNRLDVEAWRDAMLAVSGRLDLAVGGPSLNLNDRNNRRRTIYGRIDRYEVDDMLKLYDFPDPMTHSPSRDPTTTPLQQLFVLNGPFLQQRAADLAERIDRECGTGNAERGTGKAERGTGNGEAEVGSTEFRDAGLEAGVDARVQAAYRLLFGRRASEKELQLGLTFLGSTSVVTAEDRLKPELKQEPDRRRWADYCQALLGSNEFLFVD